MSAQEPVYEQFINSGQAIFEWCDGNTTDSSAISKHMDNITKSWNKLQGWLLVTCHLFFFFFSSSPPPSLPPTSPPFSYSLTSYPDLGHRWDGASIPIWVTIDKRKVRFKSSPFPTADFQELILWARFSLPAWQKYGQFCRTCSGVCFGAPRQQVIESETQMVVVCFELTVFLYICI